MSEEFGNIPQEARCVLPQVKKLHLFLIHLEKTGWPTQLRLRKFNCSVDGTDYVEHMLPV